MAMKVKVLLNFRIIIISYIKLNRYQLNIPFNIFFLKLKILKLKYLRKYRMYENIENS